jgi:hypothetical protein
MASRTTSANSGPSTPPRTGPASKTRPTKTARKASASSSAAPKRQAKPAKPAAKKALAPQSGAPSAPAASASKPAKTAKPAKAVKAVKAAKAAKSTKAKTKLVRDSFTMPRADFDLVEMLKDRALGFKRAAKKSELLRAGLHALSALSEGAFRAALEALMPVKQGRPKKGG